MKKLISILFVSALFCNCQVNSYEKEAIKDVENNYKEIVIDSCQYVVFISKSPYRGYGFMAHKGNCKFCKERRLKEQNNGKSNN